MHFCSLKLNLNWVIRVFIPSYVKKTNFLTTDCSLTGFEWKKSRRAVETIKSVKKHVTVQMIKFSADVKQLFNIQ